MEIYENATGPCIVCEKESDGSRYWLDTLPADVWEKVLPHVIHLFPNPELASSTAFFIPPYNKPFCGVECSNKYHQEKTYGNAVSV